MSIRFKQIIMMALLFTINLVTLLAYYNFRLADEMIDVLGTAQEKMEIAAEEVVTTLKEAKDLTAAMEEIDSVTNYMFTVYDFDGNLIFKSDDQEHYTVYNTTVFEIKDKTYRLKISSLEEHRNPMAMRVVKKLARFEVIALCFTLLLYGGIIHVTQLKPLEKLSKEMEQFKYGQTIKETKNRDEIGRCRNSFAAMTRRLESEKEAQNHIIASISHDIKTPLTSVMGYTERLKKNKFSEERTDRYIDMIYMKAVDIKDIVEEFDDYLGCNIKTSLNLQIINLNMIKNSIFDEYADELEARGVEFKASIEGDENTEVLIDKGKMRRVVGNIISNSLKFFDTDAPKIQFNIRKNGKYIIFTISDNGIGVDEDKLESIFTPLYTSDESRSVAGLGLAICKQIVEAHNGNIRAVKGEDKGLTIESTLLEYNPNV